MFDDSVRVGRQLKAAIKRQGLSQAQVGRNLGVSQPWVSRILNGQFGDRTDLVLRMCKAYDVAPYAHNDGVFDGVVAKLRELWDGTPAGAQKLRALLGAVLAINRDDTESAKEG